MARLAHDKYGKHRVRVSKIRRPRQAAANQERHEFVEVAVDVELEGDFAVAFTDGDNRPVVATDTCKNTIYVLAKDHPLDSIESFGLAIVQHFVDRYAHVGQCTVTLREQVWQRVNDSNHGFIANKQMTPTTQVVLARGGTPSVASGFEGFTIAKTTESGFSDFHRDEFRTLPDVDDRILATQMAANWTYGDLQCDFVAARAKIVDALVAKFLDHYSRSVQETLYLMGEAALAACGSIKQITLTMPNKHHLLANLAPFGRENHNEVFVSTDEPFGYICGTIARD